MKQNEMYKYNEFSVVLDRDGKILDKMNTARKTVVIYPHEAEYWNERIQQNKMYYELVEEIKEGKTKERLSLESEANSLGVKFRENIGDDKLQEKINEAKIK